MKDRVFEGPDKDAALQRAAETLGVPAEELRYVVLEESAGRAQIAVMGVSEAGPSPAPMLERTEYAEDDEYEEDDPVEGIRAVVNETCRTADLDVEVEVVESEDRLMARLQGADTEFFTADGGRVLRALEYLLQRTYGDIAQPRKILVDADGYREQREDNLRRQAAELVQAVRQDGETRTTEPLNSYERRIVHMVVAELPGVGSRSEGEGPRRRVFIESAG